MNILLLDGLPEEYKGVPISADFRNMIQVDLILRDAEASDAEKTWAALNQLYPEIPSDLELAMEGLTWFFARGAGTAQDEQSGEAGGRQPRAFDYDQDADLIYAAFYSTYGISLTTVDFLHWWEFLALLEGLPSDTLFKQVVYYRTADLSEMSKPERKRVQKLRRLFALKDTERERLSVEELEEKAKADLARRYEQARRWKEQNERQRR